MMQRAAEQPERRVSERSRQSTPSVVERVRARDGQLEALLDSLHLDEPVVRVDVLAAVRAECSTVPDRARLIWPICSSANWVPPRFGECTGEVASVETPDRTLAYALLASFDDKGTSVEISVSSRNTEVSEPLRQSAIEKIGRLSRFLEDMDRAEVHFSEHRSNRNPNKEVCEVTLHGHGHHVRCKVEAPDGFAAVDLAVAKLEHQLHKLKTKVLRRDKAGRRGRDGAAPGPAGAEAGVALGADDADEAGATPRIVKTKAFTIKPMTPEEAALQMDLLGHDFFFFVNADTERAAVVYQRDDGDVGLIDEA